MYRKQPYTVDNHVSLKAHDGSALATLTQLSQELYHLGGLERVLLLEGPGYTQIYIYII
jgi:hypothetical protein